RYCCGVRIKFLKKDPAQPNSERSGNFPLRLSLTAVRISVMEGLAIFFSAKYFSTSRYDRFGFAIRDKLMVTLKITNLPLHSELKLLCLYSNPHWSFVSFTIFFSWISHASTSLIT